MKLLSGVEYKEEGSSKGNAAVEPPLPVVVSAAPVMKFSGCTPLLLPPPPDEVSPGGI